MGSISPHGHEYLLDEIRQLREQLNFVRFRVAKLAGYYEKVGAVPVAELDKLLKEMP